MAGWTPRLKRCWATHFCHKLNSINDKIERVTTTYLGARRVLFSKWQSSWSSWVREME